jgi:hypothetical protein
VNLFASPPPLAAASPPTTGLISGLAQSVAGTKTFTGGVVASGVPGGPQGGLTDGIAAYLGSYNLNIGSAALWLAGTPTTTNYAIANSTSGGLGTPVGTTVNAPTGNPVNLAVNGVIKAYVSAPPSFGGVLTVNSGSVSNQGAINMINAGAGDNGIFFECGPSAGGVGIGVSSGVWRFDSTNRTQSHSVNGDVYSGSYLAAFSYSSSGGGSSLDTKPVMRVAGGASHAARMLSLVKGSSEVFGVNQLGGSVIASNTYHQLNGDGGGVNFGFRTSDGMAGFHNGAASWFGWFPGTGAAAASGGFTASAITCGTATWTDNGTASTFGHRGVNAEYWQAPLFYQTGSGVSLEAATTARLSSDAADGAAAVACSIEATAAWANASAKLLSVKNGGVEKFLISGSGNHAMPVGAAIYFGGAIAAGCYVYGASTTQLELGCNNSTALTLTAAAAALVGNLQIGTAGAARPTAAAGVRGTLWYSRSAGGVADTLEVCLKSAADTYSWKVIQTG